MSDRMRVVQVHNFYRQAGGEDVVFRAESELLRSKGHDVQEYIVRNTDIPNEGGVVTGIKSIWNGKHYVGLVHLLQEFEADVVHFHNTFPIISPAAYYAAKRMGAAVVQTLHNHRLICPAGSLFRDGAFCDQCVGKAMPWPAVVHRCYRDSLSASGAAAAMVTLHRLAGTYNRVVDRYIALSEASRRIFINGGIPASRISVRPNFLLGEHKQGYGGGEYAVFVGRIAREKGILTLLEAWRTIGRELPLRIVGDGPLLEEVRAKADEISGVTVVGRLSAPEVEAALAEARVLVFPSECYEAFGMTIIEAYAAGVPVIASGLGAALEVVEDGVTGFHFQPRVVKELVEKVQVLKSDSALRKRMGEAARGRYEALYSGEAAYSRLIQIYQEALNRREVG